MVERFSGEWKIATVKEVATISTGRRNKQDSKSFGKYPLYVRSPIVERIDVADYDCEAVLTAGDGEAGKVFHYVNGKFSAHQRVYVMNNFRNVLGRYFYYYFSHFFIHQVRKYTAKSTVDSVRKPMIADMIIALPPLEEQHAIADTLSAFDRHISALSALIAKKQAVRQGALEDLMTGRTRLEGFCGSWKTVKLGDMLKISRGASPRPIEAFLTSGTNGVNWIKIGDASKHEKYITQTAEKITEDGAAHSVRVKAGDFILSNSMSFGRPYILRIDGCIHDGWLRLYDYQDFADREFLYYLLSSSITRRQYVMFAAGSGVQNLNKEVVKKIEVNLPTLDEQLAISSVLSALDSEISALNTQHSKLSAIRNAAINDLLSGKIRLTL